MVLYVHRNRRLIRDGEPKNGPLDFHTDPDYELWAALGVFCMPRIQKNTGSACLEYRRIPEVADAEFVMP